MKKKSFKGKQLYKQVNSNNEENPIPNNKFKPTSKNENEKSNHLNSGKKSNSGFEGNVNRTSSSNSSDSSVSSKILPKEIGCYKVLGSIGGGNSCVVYKVEKDENLYALKKYNFQANIETDKIQFEKEVEFFKFGIEHKNIIKYFEANLEEKYVVMELVEGNLLDYLQDKYPLNIDNKSYGIQNPHFIEESFIKSLFFQVTIGLKEMHSRNKFHRDIKPENILYSYINEEIVFKICDFGVSKSLGLDEINRKQTAVGTEGYTPPLDPKGIITQHFSVDIWSLGIVIYQLCVRDPQFENTNVFSPINDPKLKTNFQVPNYSPRLSILFKKMLEVDYKKRINTTMIINDPYFDDLKSTIINNNLQIIDPYLICKYQFDNYDYQLCENNINLCIQNYCKRNIDRHLEQLSFLIILKLKLYLYTERYQKFKEYLDLLNNENNKGTLNEIKNRYNLFSLNYDCLELEYWYFVEGKKNENELVRLESSLVRIPSSQAGEIYIFYELLSFYLWDNDIAKSLETIKRAKEMYRDVNNEGNIGITYHLSRFFYFLGKFPAIKSENMGADSFTLNAETYAKLRCPLNNPIFLNILKDYLDNSKFQGNSKAIYDKINESIILFNSLNLNISYCFPGNRKILRYLISNYFNFLKTNQQYFLSNINSINQFVSQMDDPIIYNEFASIFFAFSNYNEASLILNKAVNSCLFSKISKNTSFIIKINLCSAYYLEGKLQDFKNLINLNPEYLRFYLTNKESFQALINMTFFELIFKIKLSIDNIPLQIIEQLSPDSKFKIFYFQFFDLYYKRDLSAIVLKFNQIEKCLQNMNKEFSGIIFQEFLICRNLCKMLCKLGGVERSMVTWTDIENVFKSNINITFVLENFSKNFFYNYMINTAIILINNCKFRDANQMLGNLSNPQYFSQNPFEKKSLDDYLALTRFLNIAQ